MVSRRYENANATAQQIVSAGGTAHAISADVMQRDQLERAAQKIIEQFGRLDILVNGAGGNRPNATTQPGQPFFDLIVFKN